MQSMKPELFLMSFLPILLFASGSALDWHTFYRNFPQIFTLAFPGVGIYMVLVAIVYKYAFPYNWTWTQSFLFGAIISATDPVAVVRDQHSKCRSVCP
jgi:NhaP-type Na+/H+ or K+/H+ antiporter